MREYRKEKVNIDGRAIPYTVFTASDYLQVHDHMSQEEVDILIDNNFEMYRMINQIIALKQSCFLLRHTTHSCQSLVEDLYALKNQLIKELKDKYYYRFGDEWMDSLVVDTYDKAELDALISKLK